MKDLANQIANIKNEIDSLERRKGEIQAALRRKKGRLKTLQKLTVNQISMLDTDGF